MGLYLCNKYFSNNKIIHVEEHNYNSFHAKKITCLLTLKDGRLASSSLDGNLNIYKEDLSKIDLSIKYKYPIHSFIQLHDGKIIICSNTKNIMILIKLKNKKQYEIIQKIILNKSMIENLYIVRSNFKVIETKNDELIAIHMGYYISRNKSQMTIWKLNKENKYEFITNIQGNQIFGILKLNKDEFVVLEEMECLSTNIYVQEEN